MASVNLVGKVLNGRDDAKVAEKVINRALEIQPLRQRTVGQSGMWGVSISISFRSHAFRDAIVQAANEHGLTVRDIR